MHDSIQVERQGKPAAVVCTAPFKNTARAIAEAQGLTNYLFAVIPHPLVTIDEATLRQRVQAALPQVLELLLAR